MLISRDRFFQVWIVIFSWLVFNGSPYAQNQDTVRRLHLQMNASARAAAGPSDNTRPPPPGNIQVLDDTVIPGSMPRQRNPQLSRDHIVIIAYDENGTEITRTAIIDPRLIRAETADEQGRISTKKIYRESVQFFVNFPNDDRITLIRLYHPRWNGSEFILDQINEMHLDRR